MCVQSTKTSTASNAARRFLHIEFVFFGESGIMRAYIVNANCPMSIEVPNRNPTGERGQSRESGDKESRIAELVERTRSQDLGLRIDAKTALSTMMKAGEVGVRTLRGLSSHEDMGIRIDANAVLENMIKTDQIPDDKALEDFAMNGEMGVRIAAATALANMITNGRLPDPRRLTGLTGHPDLGIRIAARDALRKINQT